MGNLFSTEELRANQALATEGDVNACAREAAIIVKALGFTTNPSMSRIAVVVPLVDGVVLRVTVLSDNIDRKSGYPLAVSMCLVTSDEIFYDYNDGVGEAILYGTSRASDDDVIMGIQAECTRLQGHFSKGEWEQLADRVQ